MKGNSQGHEIDDIKNEGAKNPDIELTEFTKYPVLVEELRHHILTYCGGPTLLNYSACSNHSNMEIQRINTKTPEILFIDEKIDGIVVAKKYTRSFIGKSIAIKFFTFAEVGNMTEEIQKHLMEYYKYVREKNTSSLIIDVRQWPNDVMNMKLVRNIEKWSVVINKSMYDEFMEYFQNCDHHISHLTLYDFSKTSDQTTIHSGFFKTEGFRRLKIADLRVKCEIESDDFINLEKESVYLRSFINFDDIRAKVRQWNNTRHMENSHITITLPEDDNRRFHLRVVFPAHQFEVVLFYRECCEKMRVGKVVAEVNQDLNRRSLSLTFEKD